MKTALLGAIALAPLMSLPLSAQLTDITLSREDSRIQWPAASPWDGDALQAEYKDAQLAPTADGSSLLLYMPVTRTTEGHLQTLFRLNTATGNFEDRTSDLGIDTSVARDTYDADFIDIDGDGDYDIIHSSPHGNFVLVNQGDDSFVDQTTERLPEFFRIDCLNVWDDVVGADIDADGDWDLAFANRTKTVGAGTCPGGTRRNWGPSAVLYNDGAGNFDFPQFIGEPSGVAEHDRESASHGIEFADLNNDGRLDMLVSRSSNYTDAANVIADDISLKLEHRLNLGDSDGDGLVNWAAGVSIATAGTIYNFECFDFDNDGDIDIYVGRGSADEVLLNDFMQQGDGSFTIAAIAGLTVPDGSGTSYDAIVADVNDDGFLDIAVPDADGFASNSNGLHLNERLPDGTHQLVRSNDAMIKMASPYFSLTVAFMDLDNDDRVDMIWGGDNRGGSWFPTVLRNTTAGLGNSQAPRIDTPSLSLSTAGEPAAVFRVRIADRIIDHDEITSELTNWQVQGSMGTTVNSSGPLDLAWGAKLTYQVRIPCADLEAGFQPGEVIAAFTGTVTAVDGGATSQQDTLVIDAATGATLAAQLLDPSVVGLGLTLLEPTTTDPTPVIPNNGRGRVLVRVHVRPLNLRPLASDFIVTMDGESAPVISGLQVGNEMWLAVGTPMALNGTAGALDLEVTHRLCGVEASVSATSAVFMDSPASAVLSDSVLVVDTSGSMRHDRKMESARNAAELYVNTLRDSDRIALVEYSGTAPGGYGEADFVFPANVAQMDLVGSDRSALIAAIQGLDEGGSTPLGTGLSFGLDDLSSVLAADRNPLRSILLLSDGMENVPNFWAGVPDGHPWPGEPANTPVNGEFSLPDTSDVTIHTVSLGPNADHGLMANIAAFRGGDHVQVDVVPAPESLNQASLLSSLFASLTTTGADPATSQGASPAALLNNTLSLENRLANVYEHAHNRVSQQQRLWQRTHVTKGSPGANAWDTVIVPMEPDLEFATVSVNWPGVIDAQEIVRLLPPENQNEAAIERSFGNTNTVFRIENPEAGEWRLELFNAQRVEMLITISGVGAEFGFLRTMVDTDFAEFGNLQFAVPNVPMAGEPIPLALMLVGEAPVLGAQVEGHSDSANDEESFRLLDDGQGLDRVARDGVYSGWLQQTDLGGVFDLEVTARWQGPSGSSRSRVFSSAVFLEETDSDGDTISDIDELRFGLDPNDPSDVGVDSDDDGLPDWREILEGLDPRNPDSDGGGVNDGYELKAGGDPEFAGDDDAVGTDTDGDGLPDGFEKLHGLDPSNSGDANSDTDGDGLSALEEWRNCTSPSDRDTDGDGVSDDVELEQGTDPADPKDRADIPGGGDGPGGGGDPTDPEHDTCVPLWVAILLLILFLLFLILWLMCRSEKS